MPLSFQPCRDLLDQRFGSVEQALLHHQVAPDVLDAGAEWDAIFTSKTQAYREVLLGCLLTHITDLTKDIHLPYVKMGAHAFSGRSLDENVVNPFLRAKNVPSSGGPYLSVFRRQVRFDEATRDGLKDVEGYDAFLSLLGVIAATDDQGRLLDILDYLLFRFAVMRESARVALQRLERISLEQYRQLVGALLARRSGGLFPVFLILAMVEAIIERFGLDWVADFQGINVADRASGSGGDITVREAGQTILTIEVTERPLDVARVRTTFIEKIMHVGNSDYVFLVRLARVDEQARQQIQRYFAQGYDVSTVDIHEWIINSLATVGARGRQHFQDRVVHHLSAGTVPKSLRVWWNEAISGLTG